MADFKEALTPLEVLILTLIGEARGEPIEGQVAVASVIRNRLHNNPQKYKSYKDVCLEKSQFSCWNLNDPNYPLIKEIALQLLAGQQISDPYLRQCMVVASGIEGWAIRDNTRGALNYITTKLFNSPDKPSWAQNINKFVNLGNHVFFTA